MLATVTYISAATKDTSLPLGSLRCSMMHRLSENPSLISFQDAARRAHPQGRTTSVLTAVTHACTLTHTITNRLPMSRTRAYILHGGFAGGHNLPFFKTVHSLSRRMSRNVGLGARQRHCQTQMACPSPRHQGQGRETAACWRPARHEGAGTGLPLKTSILV